MARQSRQHHGALAEAYDHFNAVLFGGELAGAVISFTNRPRVLGHFAPAKWAQVDANEMAHEIALNMGVAERDIRDIMGTLVHEMAHQWQEQFGTPGRKGYHNKEWAAKMFDLGLHPTSDGTPEGRPVGPKMTHLIIEGGRFDVAYAALPDSARAAWRDAWAMLDDTAARAKKPKSKYKYQCACEVNFWAKPGLGGITCGDCGGEFAQVEPAEPGAEGDDQGDD